MRGMGSRSAVLGRESCSSRFRLPRRGRRKTKMENSRKEELGDTCSAIM